MSPEGGVGDFARLVFLSYTGAPHGVTILRELLDAGWRPAVALIGRYRPRRWLPRLLERGAFHTLGRWPAGRCAYSTATRWLYRLDVHHEPEMEITRLCLQHGLELFFVHDHNEPILRRRLGRAGRPELVLMVGASILAVPMLRFPRLGCLNYHSGYLPDYRGQDCVYWALRNGELPGVTIHFAEERIDTGPYLLRERFGCEDCPSLAAARAKADRLGAALMRQAVRGVLDGRLTGVRPEGIKPMYKAETDDRRRAEIDRRLAEGGCGRQG